MINKLPFLTDNLEKKRICIICEGDEEHDYLDRLRKLNVWNSQYEIILDNANGSGNIPARYQNRYQSDSYDIVFIFCDTEKKPYKQYEEIKRKINIFHGVDKASDYVVIYGNPCTMQIILCHWEFVLLRSPAKRVNSVFIKELTGIDDYKGRKDQRQQLMQQITAENYRRMEENIVALKHDDTVVGSSNFSQLLQYLESENNIWIKSVNDYLEQDLT